MENLTAKQNTSIAHVGRIVVTVALALCAALILLYAVLWGAQWWGDMFGGYAEEERLSIIQDLERNAPPPVSEEVRTAIVDGLSVVQTVDVGTRIEVLKQLQ